VTTPWKRCFCGVFRGPDRENRNAGYLVTLERQDLNPLIATKFVDATMEDEAASLAKATAERLRGGRFEVVHIRPASVLSSLEVLP
jgi:hypothetical protein